MCEMDEYILFWESTLEEMPEYLEDGTLITHCGEVEQIWLEIVP